MVWLFSKAQNLLGLSPSPDKMTKLRQNEPFFEKSFSKENVSDCGLGNISNAGRRLCPVSQLLDLWDGLRV